jgi:hypothetical protein
VVAEDDYPVGLTMPPRACGHRDLRTFQWVGAVGEFGKVLEQPPHIRKPGE